jgi:hypothetical protein
VNGILRVPRRAALAAITVLVAAASLVSFAESYRGLYEWAHEHGLSGAWAVAWPLQVDVFIAVGELALFVALADRWAPRSRAAAWTVTIAGLAVSVAGNVGHVAGHSLATHVTAAVPPLAAAAALAVGLGVLKRVVDHHHNAGEGSPLAIPAGTSDEAAVVAFRASVAGGNPLSERQLADRFGIPRTRAKRIRAEVAQQANGAHAPEEIARTP